ncbi:MAG: symmetrical bis(5'-nucleosyl)-tetraphosphatase [Gammaproteobacteria bacterium]|nr:symmetrical bis(5'-nucleosyl)-tetraphosphatase [Gammaproteobacteria bacterium]MBU1731677.1 symmetrical bis(5'-nucleosyl)-tetraphosphatase [Gammaproteobacteria bacterium]MBU1892501.1 symmetrical bis(5'-nucleosyl)-tetraphosphatase [Gammaproteobacteria bacterium]
MPTYAIGDLQGCHAALEKMLEYIEFDAKKDRIWLVGDLINRGAGSAAILRWAMGLGDALVTVLGNHDLHTLAVAEGFVPLHRSDTIQDILQAPDRDELLHWLRQQPLAYRENDYFLVHAGLLPQWTPEQALALAGEVESVLRGENYRDFLEHMYGNEPRRWRNDLRGMKRLRLITNAMSRLRFCTSDGTIDFSHKGPLGSQPAELLPWFDVPGRASQGVTVLFGHWSALGLMQQPNLVALDSGCLWGGELSALRLEDRQVFQISCAGLPDSKCWK